jgi:hypothetical protein
MVSVTVYRIQLVFPIMRIPQTSIPHAGRKAQPAAPVSQPTKAVRDGVTGPVTVSPLIGESFEVCPLASANRIPLGIMGDRVDKWQS